MTAIIAVMLTLYHIARTAWLLAQFREYVRWCEYTMKCIRASRPKFSIELFTNDISDGNDDDKHSLDLERELMVNSDIVDNEFTGRYVSISLTSWRDWSLKIADPIALVGIVSILNRPFLEI